MSRKAEKRDAPLGASFGVLWEEFLQSHLEDFVHVGFVKNLGGTLLAADKAHSLAGHFTQFFVLGFYAQFAEVGGHIDFGEERDEKI